MMMYATTLTAPVFGLRREIDRLFENTFGRGHAGQNEWSPAVDIFETDQELTFAVELPGIKLENVEVTSVDGILTIQGERIVEQRGEEEGRYHLVERNHGKFLRRFQLPQGVDNEKIEANVNHGMLQVRIPKAALPQPRKIQIKAGATVGDRVQRAIGRGENREGPAEVKVAAAGQSKSR
jgi:HSP20 family protein